MPNNESCSVDPQTQAITSYHLKQIAGSAPGKWWSVYLKCRLLLDKSTPTLLCLGYVQGEKEAAIAEAKRQWPQYVGRMKLDLSQMQATRKALPNVQCELCGGFFPRERQRQTVCPCCDFS